jgi:hypothetical protein
MSGPKIEDNHMTFIGKFVKLLKNDYALVESGRF